MGGMPGRVFKARAVSWPSYMMHDASAAVLCQREAVRLCQQLVTRGIHEPATACAVHCADLQGPSVLPAGQLHTAA
jgi:hypothetical protein